MKAIVPLGGTIQLEIDEKDEMETLHKAIVLARPKQFCTVCKKDDAPKYLTSNKDKEGNIYVNWKCGCGAKSKLGQYKAGGYFWRDFEVYTPSQKGSSEAAKTG